MATTPLLTPEILISRIDGVSNVLKWAKQEIIALTRKEREMINAHYDLSDVWDQTYSDVSQASSYLNLAKEKLDQFVTEIGGGNLANIIAATGSPATLLKFSLDCVDEPNRSLIEVAVSYDDPFAGGVVTVGDHIQIVKCSLRYLEGLVGIIGSITPADPPTGARAKIVFTTEIFQDLPLFELVADPAVEVELLWLRKVAAVVA